MPKYNNIYRSGTIQRIKNELNSREYGSLDEVKEALRECRLHSFSAEFWMLTMERFLPCEKHKALLDECLRLGGEGRPPEEADSVLDRKWRKEWRKYCASAEETEPDKLVSGFMMDNCRSNPLCKSCACKEKLISFFVGIGAGSRENVRKSINNWLSGASTPDTREKYIQLCYALGLRIPGSASIPTTLNADRFLSMVCEQNPLYTRDRAELIHYYCLMRPKGKNLGFDEKYDPLKNYLYARELILKAERYTDSAAIDAGRYRLTGEAHMMVEGDINEAELLALAASCPEDDAERYHSAREMIRNFRDEFHDIYDPDGPGDRDDKETAEKKPAQQRDRRKKNKDEPEERRPTKEMSRNIIKILSEADTKQKSIEQLKRFKSDGYDICAALYWSGQTEKMAKGTEPVMRNILMLVMLLWNYGLKYDAATRSLVQTEDLVDEDELPGRNEQARRHDSEKYTSFNNFYDTITEILDSCGFAPLYPKRRFDYLVLYSYRCLTIDHDRRGRIDTIPDYLIRSLEFIAKSEEEEEDK